MIESFNDIKARLTADQGSFVAIVETFPGEPPELSFRNVLSFNDEELNQYGHVLADWTEIKDHASKFLGKLHWLTRSIIQFQDVLSIAQLDSLDDSAQLSEVFCRHHCYYDALANLRSGILSIVNANTNAAITLLRPIYEQFVYSIYWDIIRNQGRVAKYNSWLRTRKGKPPFKNAINKITEDLAKRRTTVSSLVRAIRGYLTEGYHVLCTWNHTPTINDSLYTGGIGGSPGSLRDLFYCTHMYNIALTNILHLYIFQYPMVLFPVNTFRKRGYQAPVGVFLDEYSAAIVHHGIESPLLRKLQTELSHDSEVREKLAYADRYDDLTDEEIWKTWEESEIKPQGAKRPEDITSLAAMLKGQYRSMGWALNYIAKSKILDELTQEEEEFFRKFYEE